MTTFFICLAALVAAYFLYGKFLCRVVNLDDNNAMPSKTHYDGVDYIPLPRWRIFLIQLLNIAGTGPIFGAILGACYGPVAFLWITLGGIFMGAMHDFMAGVISMRNGGKSLPETIGKYLGGNMRKFSLVVIPILMVLVGAVFIVTPSQILTDKTDIPYLVWVGIIIAYYFIATILPVDKVIGKIYPIFGAALIFMAVALFGVLLFGDYEIPELTSIRNEHFNAANLPIIPTLFISIACGAISGFHATQSPLMARCMTSESQARPIFFGAMISESIIALIWAAIAMAFFGGVAGLNGFMVENGSNAGLAVSLISDTTLGTIGSILAILGVVVAPITSGDTAFRSARLIIADMLHYDQKPIYKRLIVSLPLFAIGIGIAFMDFDTIWRYFAWSNQALSVITLWMIVAWLKRRGSRYTIIALIPAIIMTYICSSFIFVSAQFVGMGACTAAYIYGGGVTAIISGLLMLNIRRDVKRGADI
ncbi:MAG: carbon starvation protein A [Rikenellaceae bacterium]|nr:carbon starvation protein A [Rikenellaceae bacterium]